MIHLFPLFHELSMGDRHVVVRKYGECAGSAEAMRVARNSLADSNPAGRGSLIVRSLSLAILQNDQTALAISHYIVGLPDDD